MFKRCFSIYVVILLSLALHVAILCVRPLPKIEDWYDGLTYINSPCNYFQGEFDCFRTPVYPWIIDLIGFVVPEQKNLPAPMAAVQISLFLVSIPLFHGANKRILRNPYVLWIFTLGYACSLQLIYWNFIIHTESVSVFMLVLFYYGMIRFLEAPSVRWSVFVSLLSTVLLFLRPAFIYVPVLLLFFWTFRLILMSNEHQIGAFGLGATFVTCALALFYAHVNQTRSGLFTISTVHVVDQFDDIINANIWRAAANSPVNLNGDSAADSDTEIITVAETVARVEQLLAEEQQRPEASLHGESHAFVFQQLQKRFGYTLPQIQDYVKVCLWNDWRGYVGFKCRIAASLARAPLFLILYLVGAIELALLLTFWICRRTVPWLRLGIWSLVFGALTVAILGGNSVPGNPLYYQRLITPILPVFYVLIALWSDWLFVLSAPISISDSQV